MNSEEAARRHVPVPVPACGEIMRDGSGDTTEFDSRIGWAKPWIRIGIWLFPGVAFVFPILFPNWSSVQVQRYSLAATVILAGACAAFEVWQRRRRPPAAAPPAATPLETSMLRSFLPFERGDTLLGRRDDVADALAVLQASEFRFGVIWGESGCGKTSFLRAGVVPALADKGHHPVYLARPTDDPGAAIEHAVWGAPCCARVFVLVDQFEEYFLTHPSPGAAAALGAQFQALLHANPGVALVLGIRRDFFARLQQLAPAVPDPTSPRTTFELGNLRTAAARDVLNQAANAESVQFEAALVDAVIDDLEADGTVWPVELQLLGTRLKRARVRQKSDYAALGRKAGVIGTFIRDEVARLPKPVLGEIVLRKLCAPGAIAKSPVDLSYAELAEDVRARDPSLLSGTELATCLAMLQQARIVVQTGEASFNLAHDALAPLIERGTTGLQGQAEAADRSLSFYLGAYRQDRSVRIPVRALLQIRRHGNRTTLADSQVRQLLAQSWRHVVFTVTWPAGLALVVLAGSGYAIALGSWSVGTAPSSLASNPLSIAIRSGNPYTRNLPGADRVIAETAVDVDQLDTAGAAALNQVLRGEFWAFGSGQGAIGKIASLLAPLDQLAFLRGAGQAQAAAATFVTTVQRHEPQAGQLLAAANAIGLVGRADTEAATLAVAERLLRELNAVQAAQWELHLPVSVALLRMAEQHGGVPAHALPTLGQVHALLRRQMTGVLFPLQSDGAVMLQLIEAAIDQRLLNGATAPTPHDFAALVAIIDDSPNASWVPTHGLSLLSRYTMRNADLAVPALDYLIERALRAAPGDDVNLAAAMEFARLAETWPAAAQHPAIRQTLASGRLSAPGADVIDLLALPLSRLGRAAPSALPAQFVAALQARAADAATPGATQDIASIALLRLALSDAALRDEGIKQHVFDLLQSLQGRTSANAATIRHEAFLVAAEMASLGQLDQESVQRLMDLLARGPVSRAPGIGFRFEDSDLIASRLARAGARFEPRFFTAMVALVGSVDSIGMHAAGRLLIVGAKAAPQQFLTGQAALEKVTYESRGDLRALVLAAYGQADAATGSAQARRDRCMALLVNGRDAQAWQRGAYCAFFAALDNPATLAAWTADLQDLANQGVAQTIAARMAREMLINVRRVADATGHPDRVPLLMARLRYDSKDREAHVAIAARAAMLALDGRQR